MSRMFTTCPACRLNLAVTPTDLRIGQGYVRCGRCERVFNALLSLSEDLEQEQQSGLAATGTTTVPALEEPGEEPATATDDDANWARITPIRSPETHDVDVVESQATGTVETIVLEGDGYSQTEEHVDEQEVDAQLQELARQMDSRNAADAADDDVQVEEHPSEDVVMETDAATLAAELDADAAVGNPRRQHWAWTAAAAVLALALLAQFVHHSRHSLVAHPWLERPMQSLYGIFGVTLEPKWDLRAYDVRRLGEAMAGATDQIVLRASVHNRAPNSQPPPMIRVVLEDRFGNALSTTAIAPKDYVPGEAPARMAPDQRLDALLTLPDPNRQAEGFQLDTCLPGAGGKLHCSNDP
jgi:predicted Zn finger-like uncharacterized protein